MKKAITLIAVAFIALLAIFLFSGCTQADKVSQSLSSEADNFNIERRLVAINTRSDTILLEVVGTMSIYKDVEAAQLEITVKDGSSYKKHFVGLDSTDVIYTVEDVTGTNVNPNRYQISYLPEAIIPAEFKDGSK